MKDSDGTAKDEKVAARETARRLGNPAGRLLEVIEAVKKYAEQKPDAKAYVALISVLHVETGDISRVYERWGEVMALPDACGRAFTQYRQDRSDLYLSWVPDLQQRWRSRNLEEPIKSWADAVTADLRDRVAFCDDQLQLLCPEVLFDRKAIADALAAVRSAIWYVTHTRMTSATESFILKYLFIIEQALVEYEFRGEDAINEAYLQCVGMRDVGQEAIEETKHIKISMEDGSDYPLWDEIAAASKKLEVVVETAERTSEQSERLMVLGEKWGKRVMKVGLLLEKLVHSSST